MDGFRRIIIIREEKRIKGVITRKTIFYYAGIKDRSHKEQASNCKGEGGDFHPILGTSLLHMTSIMCVFPQMDKI